MTNCVKDDASHIHCTQPYRVAQDLDQSKVDTALPGTCTSGLATWELYHEYEYANIWYFEWQGGKSGWVNTGVVDTATDPSYVPKDLGEVWEQQGCV